MTWCLNVLYSMYITWLPLSNPERATHAWHRREPHCQYRPMYLSHTAILLSSVWTHVSVPHCNTAIISMDPCICATQQHCCCQYWPMYLSHTVTLPLSRPMAMWEVQVEMVLQVMLVEKGHTTSGLCSTSETQQVSKLVFYIWNPANP